MTQEIDLARKIRAGDTEALDSWSTRTCRFVVSVAKRYLNRGLGYMDLIAEGNVGLITAAKRFDERREFRFVTYAVWWIRQSIQTALQDQTRTVRLPANRAREATRIKKAERQLEQDKMGAVHGRGAFRAGGHLPAQGGADQGHRQPYICLDETPREDSPSLAETLSDPELELQSDGRGTRGHEPGAGRGPEPAERAGTVTSSSGITDWDQQPRQSLEAIGQTIRLSRERVRQIRNRAFAKIRDCYQGQVLAEYLG